MAENFPLITLISGPLAGLARALPVRLPLAVEYTLTPLVGVARAPPIKGVRADSASRVEDAPRFPRCDARGSTASVGQHARASPKG